MATVEKPISTLSSLPTTCDVFGDIAERIQVAVKSLTAAQQQLERASIGEVEVFPKADDGDDSAPRNFLAKMAQAEDAIGDSHILAPPVAKKLLEDEPESLFLDVQEKGASLIPGSHRVPLGELFFRASNDPPHLADPVITERDKDAPILVTCGQGGQAKIAAKLLKDYGYTNLYCVRGGCDAWLAELTNHVPNLPVGWPETLEQRRSLQGFKTTLPNGASALFIDENAPVPEVSLQPSLLSMEPSADLHPRFVLSPASAPRSVLDFCSVLALAFDLVTVPWLLAWDVPIKGWLRVCSVCLAIFWTVDIFASFRTGFYAKGEVQMRPKFIAVRYLKTWFLPDLIIVLLDWASIFLLESDLFGHDSELQLQLSSILRVTKWNRFLRLAGVARFIRFSDIIDRITDRTSHSPNASLAIQVARLVFCVMYVNHLGACLWWAVGKTAVSSTGARWIDEDTGRGTTFADSDLFSQYVTSLHWAVAQILAGSVDVIAVNTAERVFSVICVIFGVLYFSSLVSMLTAKMTAKMTQLRAAQAERNEKLGQLSEFLRTKGVNTELAVNITKQVSTTMEEKKPDTPSDLQAWPFLSPAHQKELRRELCTPHLMKHPFFLLVGHIEAKLINCLCDKAVNITVHSQHDVIFVPGTVASKAYMLIHGRMRYSQDEDHGIVSKAVSRRIDEGSWVCEAALWTSWVTVGTLETSTVCEVLEVHADSMVEVLERLPYNAREHSRLFHSVQVSQVTSEYSMAKLTRIRAAKAPHAQLPDDAFLPCASHAEIMASLSTETRAFAGKLAMKSLASHRPWFFGQEQLQSEVTEGKRTAVLTGLGEVELVSAETSVRLSHSDGTVLVQLGVWDGHAAVAACGLPSTELQAHEVPFDAAYRLISEQLAPLAEYTQVTRLLQETVELSEGVSLPERVFCTEYEAQLDDNCCPPLPRAGHESGCALSRHVTPEASQSLVFDKVLLMAGPSEDEGRVMRLFTWANPDELAFLDSPTGQAELRKFLSSVSVSQEAAEDAMDTTREPRWRSTVSSDGLASNPVTHSPATTGSHLRL